MTTAYVLGTGDDELARLTFQHQVWRASTTAHWDRAGFAPGQRLLDLGCGPGFASEDLAALVGPTGHVTAIDASARYIEHLLARPTAPGRAPIDARVGDAIALDLDDKSLDGAYMRWVLCFVPGADRVVAQLAHALRPGGVLAVHDYLAYRGMKLAPHSDIFDHVVAKIDESWRAHGSVTDVLLDLPAQCESHGLRVKELRPLVRTGAPGSTLWAWLSAFFKTYVPKLQQAGFIDADERDAFFLEWIRREDVPGAHVVTSLIGELTAVR